MIWIDLDGLLPGEHLGSGRINKMPPGYCLDTGMGLEAGLVPASCGSKRSADCRFSAESMSILGWWCAMNRGILRFANNLIFCKVLAALRDDEVEVTNTCGEKFPHRTSGSFEIFRSISALSASHNVSEETPERGPRHKKHQGAFEPISSCQDWPKR